MESKPQPPDALKRYMAQHPQRHAAGTFAQDDEPNIESARHLANAYPELKPAVVDNLLRRGEVMNLISGPKTYKTFSVLNLAVDIATGDDFLDRFACRQGRVLCIDAELHRATMAKRLRDVISARGAEAQDAWDAIDIISLRGKRYDINRLSTLVDKIEPGAYAVVVIDPLFKLLPADADENSNNDIAQVYSALDALAERLDAAVVVVHHASKGGQADKHATDIGAGGGAQSRAADCHATLRRHEEADAAVFDCVVRSFAPIEPFAVRWIYPRWRQASDLDPGKLHRPGRSRSATATAPTPATPKADHSPEAFVRAFVKAEPATRATILARATSASWPSKASSNAFALALDQQLMHERDTADKRVRAYSTEPAMLTDTLDEEYIYRARPPHTPPETLKRPGGRDNGAHSSIPTSNRRQPE